MNEDKPIKGPFLDTCASRSFCPEDNPDLIVIREEINFVRAFDTKVVKYTKVGLHKFVGWCIVGQAPGLIVSYAQALEVFSITLAEYPHRFILTYKADDTVQLKAVLEHGVMVLQHMDGSPLEKGFPVEKLEEEMIMFTHLAPLREGVEVVLYYAYRESNSKSEHNRWWLLHEILAHAPQEVLLVMHRAGCFPTWNLTEQGLKRSGIPTCYACLAGKAGTIHHEHHPVPRPPRLVEIFTVT